MCVMPLEAIQAELIKFPQLILEVWKWEIVSWGKIGDT
jgi:hypothetical protein